MLFFLPYLAVPILLAVVVRMLKLERWLFMTYFLCAGLLFYWPSLWQDYHTPQPSSEPEVDNLFPGLAAVFFIPIALFVQWVSNSILARKAT